MVENESGCFAASTIYSSSIDFLSSLCFTVCKFHLSGSTYQFVHIFHKASFDLV